MRKAIQFLFAASAIILLLVPFLAAHADQAESFRTGEALNHMLSVCLDKKVATDILKADSEKGFATADVMWSSADNCATIPVVGAVVGKVVLSAPIKRNGKEFTGKIVEILDPKTGEAIAWFITSLPVEGPMPKSGIVIPPLHTQNRA